jgi:hypothetical protein
MVIPGFVKTGQMFQIFECEVQTNRGTRANGDIKVCILEIFIFQKSKRRSTQISIKPVCPLFSSLEPADRFSLNMKLIHLKVTLNAESFISHQSVLRT